MYTARADVDILQAGTHPASAQGLQPDYATMPQGAPAGEAGRIRASEGLTLPSKLCVRWIAVTCDENNIPCQKFLCCHIKVKRELTFRSVFMRGSYITFHAYQLV